MAGRDPWDIPTPTQGAPTQALTQMRSMLDI